MKYEEMQAVMPPNEMIELFTLKMESNQPIETIAQRVPAGCETHKFALLYTYNYHEIVESKGFPIKRKVFIYEICQAKVASKMLTTNPEFSIFMPCKIALYEQDGKTVIATMNMEILLKAVEENRELYIEAMALFNNLKSLLSALKNG